VSATGRLALCAGISFSSSLFLMGRVRQYPPLAVATYALIAAAFWSVPMALAIDGMPTGVPGRSALGALVVLIVFNTAAANMLLFALVPRTSPSFTAVNNYIVPTIAVICGSLFLAEPVTQRGILGVVIVLSGVAISTMRPRSAVVA
jgi:drug/metabolite transporter (DMT)-like permease